MRKILHKLVYKQVVWWGLDHYWALFAPEPVSLFFRVGFRIILRNGTSVSFQVPRFAGTKNIGPTKMTRYLKWYYTLVSKGDDVSKEAICEYVYIMYMKKVGVEPPSYIKIIMYYKPSAFARHSELPWMEREIYRYQEPPIRPVDR